MLELLGCVALALLFLTGSAVLLGASRMAMAEGNLGDALADLAAAGRRGIPIMGIMHPRVEWDKQPLITLHDPHAIYRWPRAE